MCSVVFLIEIFMILPNVNTITIWIIQYKNSRLIEFIIMIFCVL